MSDPAPVTSLSDLAIGLIRTVVPAIVGTALAWAASKGLDLTQYGNAVNAWLVPVVIGLYYGLARLLERKWPQLGLLLGARRQPVYIAPDGLPVTPPAVPPTPPGL